MCTDEAILSGAVRVIEQFGYDALTMERLADAVGSSRMTLHRRKITVAAVVAGLSIRAAGELRDELFPILTATGPADERLSAALSAMCAVADRHLALLSGLFSDDRGVFHAEPDESGVLPTHEIFIAPFAKLLADGAADGSLVSQADPIETATVLFNTAGWGYIQLRQAQGWPEERAREGVVTLVMSGLRANAAV